MTSNDFILAQQRLAARRQAREVAAQTHLNRRRNTAISQRVSSLPFPFSRLGTAGLTTWDTISGREGTRPAFRVGQVDAELLDEELLDLLKGQVGEGLKYFGTHIQDDWSAEIMLALRAILFKLSIWDHDATYGATLQNLKFTDARHSGPVLVSPSKWQKSLYGLFTVGGKYAWTRWENYLVDSDNGYNTPSPLMSRLSRITDLLTNISHFARSNPTTPTSTPNKPSQQRSIIRVSQSPTCMARIHRISPFRTPAGRHFSLETFALPCLETCEISFQHIIPDELSINEKKGELSFLPERTCAICYHDQNALQATEEGVMAAAASTGVIGSAQTDITNPYETVECGCIYCFVCIASKLEAEEGEGWTCLRCGEDVKGCRAWSGDVVIEAPAAAPAPIVEKEQVPKPRKSVEFQDDRMKIVDPKSEDGGSSDRDSQLGQEEAYDEDEDQGLEEYEDEAE
ncbi:Pex2/Pex12 amino terminal region [Botrytis cinerea]